MIFYDNLLLANDDNKFKSTALNPASYADIYPHLDDIENSILSADNIYLLPACPFFPYFYR